MGLLLPILFAVASLASFLRFKFLKNIKEWLKYVFFGLTIGFLIVSMTFAYLFVIDTFALDNVVRGCFAATFLYGFAISVLFFILTIKKENKIYGIVFTGTTLLFGVLFLVFGFIFGRESLHNEEEIIKSSTSAIALLFNL